MDRIKNYFWGYLVAFLAVSLAVLTHQFALSSIFGHQFPFVLLLLAVVVTAWTSGWKPGLLALVLAVLASTVIFDHHRLGDSPALGQLRLAFFIVIGGLACYWMGRIGAQQRRIAVETQIRQEAELILREREEHL